jgi:hypothetical protein
MTVPMLSNAVIANALKQARVLGCPPEGRHCAVWPAQVTSALQTLTTDGWCVIGGVEDARAHGPIWKAWFQVDSGEVRLELDVQRLKKRRGRR